MPPNVVTRFNARIRDFLKLHNLRQIDLARALGIARPTVSLLLNGDLTQSWHLDRQRAMARYYAKVTGYTGAITLKWFFNELDL